MGGRWKQAASKVSMGRSYSSVGEDEVRRRMVWVFWMCDGGRTDATGSRFGEDEGIYGSS